MRVVFDTNTVVSGLLWVGAPREALAAVRAKKAILVSSDAMLTELETVLSRRKFASRIAEADSSVEEFLGDYKALVEVVTPAEIGAVILADPKDDKVLACAVGGQVELIVSGDHHLLDLQVYETISIINVHDFLELVSQ